MQLSGPRRWLLSLASAFTLAFLYLPLIVIAIYAFNSTRVQKWPPAGLTFSWFDRALHNPGVRDALATSAPRSCGSVTSRNVCHVSAPRSALASSNETDVRRRRATTLL